ncbi:PARP15 [Symbiodinium sp. KB8]|nr:PARP15 [Symbiodinium sp. KB8]
MLTKPSSGRRWAGSVVVLCSCRLAEAQSPGGSLPAECLEFATCSRAQGADWQGFSRQVRQAAELEQSMQHQAAMEIYHALMESHALDAGIALQCRMGAATVFYRQGRLYLHLGYPQRASNLFQLAMSMFWDASRAENGMACLQYEMWGIRWFDDFMETYLRNAANLRRNDLSMLPHLSDLQVPPNYRDPSLRIAVFSLCDYAPESPMHWLLGRSRQNREAYCSRHGYGLEWTSQRPASSKGRHPVWGQIAGPLELLGDGRYDWVLSMDCDSLFTDMTVTVDSLLYRFASRATPWGKLEIDPLVHFLISEDGRGLAGGNWIVRNSREGRAFLSEIFGSDDESQNPYMRHDLRDQFSLLWHLVRPGVSVPMPREEAVSMPQAPKSWSAIGYRELARLVPQDLLLGSYPYVSCSQPGDQAHRCFGEGPKDKDFIVSVPLLGALPAQLAQVLLDRFLLESLGSFGQPAYEQELRGMCASVDVSRCLVGESGPSQCRLHDLAACIKPVSLQNLPCSWAPPPPARSECNGATMMYAKRPAFSLTNGRSRKGKEGYKEGKDKATKLEKEIKPQVRSKSLAELLEAEENGQGNKLEEALLAVFRLIDADSGGSISKLEFIGAVYRHALVASFVLQGHGLSPELQNDPSGQVAINEQSFDAVDDVFDSMSGGSARVKYPEFAAYFRRLANVCLAAQTEEKGMKEVFGSLDADANGSFSKLDMVAAMQSSTRAASYLLPGLDTRKVLEDERSYDAVCSLFDHMAAGRQCVQWQDFKTFCLHTRFQKAWDSSPSTTCSSPLSPSSPESSDERSSSKVLIIAPGFGRERHPQQAALLANAGFQMHWCRDLPEYADEGARLSYHAVAPYLNKIRDEIVNVQPRVVIAASQGGAYLVGLWQLGYWNGPSVMLNAHPSLPMRLPAAASIVLAHGSNDEAYLWNRGDLEELMTTGPANRCLLYYTANSGHLASGSLTRLGDRHVMGSILQNNTLPRLVDAALSFMGPELHLIESWRNQLSESRLEAQHWLGYSLERLRRLWASPGRLGRETSALFPVSPKSEEFRRVQAIFRAAPVEPPAYMLSSQASWERLPIHRIERVENGGQMECSTIPYRDGLRNSLREQGVDFDPSIHACWAFHGADQESLLSIIRDPVSGFQPLISGSRNSPVWGSGTYFARDAKYVADGQFCPRQRDGSRCMLLCLVMLGMPCLGDPNQKGVLPFRQKPHRYNSAVDSLSSPEVYVTQMVGAAHPAYLITFA